MRAYILALALSLVATSAFATLVLRQPLSATPSGASPPVWTAPAVSGLGSAARGETVDVPLAAEDPAGTPVTFQLAPGSTLPAGLTLQGGRLGGTVAASAATGVADFTVLAVDGQGDSAPRRFTLTIGEAAPSWVTPAGTVLATVLQGRALPAPVSALATDPEGDLSAFRIVAGALPAALSLTEATGGISGLVGRLTPAGRYDVTLEVADSGGRTARRAFAIDVTVNGAPVWVTPETLAGVSAYADFAPTTVQATDPEGRAVSYALAVGSLPPGLTLDGATGTITGRPTRSGVNGFTLRATDADGVAADRAFTWSVAAQRTCRTIKTAWPAAPDGAYEIDVDGAGAAFGPVDTWCDMTVDGGGWTLFLRSDGSTATGSPVFSTAEVAASTLASVPATGQAKLSDAAYNQLNPTEIWAICGGRQTFYARNTSVAWNTNHGTPDSCSYMTNFYSGYRNGLSGVWTSGVGKTYQACGAFYDPTVGWTVITGIHVNDPRYRGCHSGSDVATAPANWVARTGTAGANEWNRNGYVLVREGSNRPPVWTATGTSPTAYVNHTSISLAGATDPEGGTLSYSVAAGTLPAGLTLSASGVLSGRATTLADVATTRTLRVRATDPQGIATDGPVTLTLGAPRDCATILAGWAAAPSGIYRIDPDLGGAEPAVDVYCDMVNQGGGWTLFMKVQANVVVQSTAAVNPAGLASVADTTHAKLSDTAYNAINPTEVWSLCGGLQAILVRNRATAWYTNHGVTDFCRYSRNFFTGARTTHGGTVTTGLAYNGSCGGVFVSGVGWSPLSGIHINDPDHPGCYAGQWGAARNVYSLLGSGSGWGQPGFVFIR